MLRMRARKHFLSVHDYFKYYCLNLKVHIHKFNHEFSEEEIDIIIKTLNEADEEDLTRYKIAKTKLKNFLKWKTKNETVKSLADMENVEGFSKSVCLKFFKSILSGGSDNIDMSQRIRGNILYPALDEVVRESCESALALDVMVNSVAWAKVNPSNMLVSDWHCHPISVQDNKKLLITDIVNIAETCMRLVPPSDVVVMRAPASTLRAGGAGPGGARQLSVNLQRAQLTAMLVAHLNARRLLPRSPERSVNLVDENQQIVYFLRPHLPYRLFGTLVGNEEVSSESTVERILKRESDLGADSQLTVPQNLIDYYNSQKDLEKDVLGKTLLLLLTFVYICIIKERSAVTRLAKSMK